MKKWILRLLVFIAVVIGLTLFGLRIMSGTSDTHKRGLEQAFSEIFKGQATFGTLKTFNLFPQLTVEIEKLQVLQADDLGNIMADHFLIAFGPVDLMTKSRLIENFQVQNLDIAQGLYTQEALHLDKMGLYPTDKADEGKLSFKGKYGPQDLEGEFAVGVQSGARLKYFFHESNPFTINVGAVQIKGIFTPYQVGGASMHDITLTAQQIDNNIGCRIKDGQSMEFATFIKDVLNQVTAVKTPQDLNTICSSYK